MALGMVDLNAAIQQQMQGTATRVGTVHKNGASTTIEDDGSIEGRTSSGMGFRIDATTGVVSLVGSDIQQWCTTLEIQGSHGSSIVLNDNQIQLTDVHGSSLTLDVDHIIGLFNGAKVEVMNDGLTINVTNSSGAGIAISADSLTASMNGSKFELMADGSTLTACNGAGMGLFVTGETTTVVGPSGCQEILSYNSVDGRVITMDCDKFAS